MVNASKKKEARKVVIADLPAAEKALTVEEMRVVRGGDGGLGGSKPGQEYVTMKYPSDGDDDIYV